MAVCVCLGNRNHLVQGVLAVISFPDNHLEVNRGNLEKCILQQASLYDYYAKEAAEVEAKVNRKKNDIEVKTAALKIQVRKNWTEAKAPTIDQIEAIVITDAELQALKSELFDLMEYHGKLKARVAAVTQKRDMIETEVKIILSKSYEPVDCIPDPEVKDEWNKSQF